MRRRQTVVISGLVLLLGAGCVTEEPSTEPPGEVSTFIVDKAPDKITPLNVNFDDKITLLGVELDPGTEVAAGKRVKMTLYWRVDKALDDPEWKLFTHVLDGAGDRVMNIDNVGPLRSGKGGQAWPPGRWKPGKVYVDTQTFNMPRKLKSNSVQVVTGIWKGRDRMPVRGGPSVADDRALVATLTLAAKAKPERTVPQLEVTRLLKGAAIKLDGALDEAAWKDAADTSTFVDVRKGGPDADSTVQGSAKLLWDDKWLYVGATIQDDEVEGGFDKAQKDPHLWTKDCLEIMVDPDGDGDNVDYYEVQINPQNLVFDSRFDEYNKPRQEPDGPFGHQDWTAKLESAVKVDGTLDKNDDEDRGYVVEARIPWSSFDKAKAAPPKPGDSWRLNLYAMHDNSGVAWSPVLGQGNFHKASRFARVVWVDKKSEPLALAAQGPEKVPAGPATPATAAAAAKPEDSNIVVQKKALQQLPSPPPAQPSPAVPPPPPKPAPVTAPASAPAQ
jgi:cellulose/xylan binding protein with CBM9 domain